MFGIAGTENVMEGKMRERWRVPSFNRLAARLSVILNFEGLGGAQFVSFNKFGLDRRDTPPAHCRKLRKGTARPLMFSLMFN